MVSRFRPFGRIATPPEGLDAVLDIAAELVGFPLRAGSNIAGAAQQTFQGVKQGLDLPKNVAGVPADPGTVANGALTGIAAIGQGIAGAFNGLIQAATETGNGVKSQIDALIR